MSLPEYQKTPIKFNTRHHQLTSSSSPCPISEVIQQSPISQQAKNTRVGASLSSFALPSWGRGNEDKKSNIRVIAKIRPMSELEIRKGSNGVIFAATSDTLESYDTVSPLTSPVSSSYYTAGNSVSDLAAKFENQATAPPTIITTPSKFNYTKSSPRSQLSYFSTDNKASNRPSIQECPSSTRSVLSSISNTFPTKGLIQTLSIKSSQNPNLTSQNPNLLLDYDAVLDSSNSQDDVYKKSVGDAVRRNIFRGFNTTIIAYGQRKSGKSYTMFGPVDDDKENNSDISAYSPRRSTPKKNIRNFNSPNPAENVIPAHEGGSDILSEEDGIIPRAINDLFVAKKRHATGGEVTISLSYFDICAENVNDLLTFRRSMNEVQQTRDVSQGKGLSSVRLQSLSHAKRIIQNADAKRSQYRSNCNNHIICVLHVTIHPATKSCVTSGKMSSLTSTDVVSAKLTLVDLAGPERYSEARKANLGVNKDLLVFRKCIKALASMNKNSNNKKEQHVPYKESKLTTFLRDSLGGNCCTVMIACVSPCERDLSESMNTLNYATEAKFITNNTRKNVVRSTVTPAEGAALRRENKVLKSQVLSLDRKVQFLRRAKSSTPTFSRQANRTIEEKDTFDENMNCNLQPVGLASIEAQRWKMKFEKLSQICIDAGINTEGAALSDSDEAILVSHQNELQDLRDQLEQLLSCENDDGLSVTSGLTINTEGYTCGGDEIDDVSIFSTNNTISSLSNQRNLLASQTFTEKMKSAFKNAKIEDRFLISQIDEKKKMIDDLDSKIAQKELVYESEIDGKKSQVTLHIAELNNQLNNLKEEKDILFNSMVDKSKSLRRIEDEIIEKKKFLYVDLEDVKRCLDTEIEDKNKVIEKLTKEEMTIVKKITAFQEDCNELELQKLELEASSKAKYDELVSAYKMDEKKFNELLEMKQLELNAIQNEHDIIQKSIIEKRQEIENITSNIEEEKNEFTQLRIEHGKCVIDTAQRQQEEESEDVMSLKNEKASKLDLQLQNLKKELKSLNEEKSFLVEEVIGLQDLQELISENNYEKERRAQAEKDIETLKQENASMSVELDKSITDAKLKDSTIRDLEEKVSSLENAISSLRKEQSVHTVTRPILKDQIIYDKPPLPLSGSKKRKELVIEQQKLRSITTPKKRKTDIDEFDNCSVSSVLSVSNLLNDYKPELDNSIDESILFDFSIETSVLDNKNVYIDNMDSSILTATDRSIRDHAQRVLFWADRSVQKKNNINDLSDSFSVSSTTSSFVTEFSTNVFRDESWRNQQLTCICGNSLFSGNDDHTEFFLPMLGLACKCGAELPRSENNDDPSMVSYYLRPWQVAFLKSQKISTVNQLVIAEESNGKELVKAMKRWRHKMKLKPAKSKSCYIALHTWAKTCKIALKKSTNTKKEDKVIEIKQDKSPPATSLQVLDSSKLKNQKRTTKTIDNSIGDDYSKENRNPNSNDVPPIKSVLCLEIEQNKNQRSSTIVLDNDDDEHTVSTIGSEMNIRRYGSMSWDDPLHEEEYEI